MTMKRYRKIHRQYFFLFPGNAYAIMFYAFNKKDAKYVAKRFLGTERLPNNTQIWNN